MTGRPFHLAVIGGGATGSLALLKAVTLSDPHPMQITMIEPSAHLGLGRAYSTRIESHLLNVPVKKMSIFQDSPDDFYQWLLTHHPDAEKSSAWPFVPRIWFGEYLKEKMKGLASSAYVHLQKTAKSISKSSEKSGESFQITLNDGSSVTADGIVVATGYQQAISARVLGGQVMGQTSSRILQPYNSDELRKIQSQDSVLIIGTGLTAIDVFRELHREIDGKLARPEMHFLSRRGMFPISHDLILQTPLQGSANLEGVAPVQIFKELRLAQKEQKVSWVAVADHVRVQVQKVWQSWKSPERKRFVRHLKPYWENIRHRIPPSVALELGQYLKSHPDRLHSGRIQSTEVHGDHLKVISSGKSLRSPTLFRNWIKSLGKFSKLLRKREPFKTPWPTSREESLQKF
jgi:uncharacterized NAD(P)/FAD-binding protein YdhS